MSTIGNVGPVSGSTQTGGSTNIPSRNEESVSIFSDKNGNNIVDLSDFGHASYAKLAEEKGLIGKAWDVVKDFISDLLDLNPLSEKSETVRNKAINRLNEKGIEYKENSDGSIEYTENGVLIKDSWYGDTNNTELQYQDGSIIQAYSKYSNKSNVVEYSNGKGLSQVMYKDSEGNKTIKNYKQDENGNMIETNDYVVSFCNEDGVKIYTGSDIAQMIKSEDVMEPKKLFGYNFVQEDLSRDGGSKTWNFKDGTTVYLDNSFFSREEGYVTITRPDGSFEKYNPEGERVYE